MSLSGGREKLTLSGFQYAWMQNNLTFMVMRAGLVMLSLIHI